MHVCSRDCTKRDVPFGESASDRYKCFNSTQNRLWDPHVSCMNFPRKRPNAHKTAYRERCRIACVNKIRLHFASILHRTKRKNNCMQEKSNTAVRNSLWRRQSCDGKPIFNGVVFERIFLDVRATI